MLKASKDFFYGFIGKSLSQKEAVVNYRISESELNLSFSTNPTEFLFRFIRFSMRLYFRQTKL